LDCNVTITADDNLPLTVADNASIALDLNGHTLTVNAPELNAGIGVPAGTSLTIDDTSTAGTGKTMATGGPYGAGMGGGDHESAGSIPVKGGTVTAEGGGSGAGIGGGQVGAGGHITVTG